MSVRQIGRRWQVRLRLGAGNRFEKTLPRGATRADALQLEAKVRRAQIDAEIGRRPRYLIDDAIDRWIERGAKNLKSWKADLRYRSDVLRGYTAGKALEQLPEVAERVKEDGLREGLSAGGVNRYLAILRRVGNEAERWGWTEKPIGRRVVLLPENGARYVFFTRQQIQRLARAAEPLTGDMVRFNVLSGLRLSELLGLRPEKVVRGRVLLDERTKSGKPRVVPIPPEAVRIARRRLGTKGWGLSKYQARDRLLRARKAAGLEKLRGWHDLRHTYGSWLAQRGVPLPVIRDLMGHSSLAVTSRYAHMAPRHLEQAARSLPKLG